MDNQFDADRHDFGPPVPKQRPPLAAFFYQRAADAQGFLTFGYEEAKRQDATEVEIVSACELILFAFGCAEDIMKERWHYHELRNTVPELTQSNIDSIVVMYACVSAVRHWWVKIGERLHDRGITRSLLGFFACGKEVTYTMGADVGSSAFDAALRFCTTVEGCIDFAMEDAIGYPNGETYVPQSSPFSGSFLPENRELLTEDVIDDFHGNLLFQLYGYEDQMIPSPKEWSLWEFTRDAKIIRQHMRWELAKLRRPSVDSLRSALEAEPGAIGSQSQSTDKSELIGKPKRSPYDGSELKLSTGTWSVVAFTLRDLAACCSKTCKPEIDRGDSVKQYLDGAIRKISEKRWRVCFTNLPESAIKSRLKSLESLRSSGDKSEPEGYFWWPKNKDS